jgi:hypothetical protein
MDGMFIAKERKYYAGGTLPAKKKKRNKFGKVMREGFAGKLHSGKGGPIVKDPQQMKAIAASVSGTSKPTGIAFHKKG